jgi:hypothetical protein
LYTDSQDPSILICTQYSLYSHYSLYALLNVSLYSPSDSSYSLCALYSVYVTVILELLTVKGEDKDWYHLLITEYVGQVSTCHLPDQIRTKQGVMQSKVQFSRISITVPVASF